MNIKEWSYQDKKNLGSYLQWNSFRSERHRLFYVATPKVACTTIKWWFAKVEGATQLILEDSTSAETDPDLVIHDTFYKVAPKVTGLPLDELIPPLFSDKYFRFAVVRNPYKRIFSAWQSKLLLREPLQIGPYVKESFNLHPINSVLDVASAFEMFLEHLSENEAPAYWDSHWAPQVDLLRPDLINYSCLAKIEDFETLERKLREWLGDSIAGPFDGHRSNESVIPYSPDFITEHSTEIIRSLYAEDFDVFGYDAKVPFVKNIFSEEQCEVAIKAVKLLRGRHQRFGERNKQITNLNHAVTERDGQITNLNHAVTERDGQIASLRQAVTVRDGQIASLRQAVTERDGQIASLSQAVTERDGQIASLAGTVEEIYRSNSWRLLAPLRYYGRQRRRLVWLLRALPVVRARAGGLLPLLRFALRVFRQDGPAAVKSLALQQIERSVTSQLVTRATDESAIVKCGPEILFVSHEASRTGAPIFLLNMARLLKQELGLGCAFLLCSGGELEDQFSALGPTWVLGDRLVLPPQTLDALKRRDIRLVYSNTVTNGAIQQRLKELVCPILCHVHELGYSIERNFGGNNVKSIRATTDFFLAGSSVVAEYLTGQWQLPADKVAIAHPFVDVGANCRAVAHSTPPLDLPTDAIVVGACGTIGWRKGTDLFVQVAQRVLERTVRPIHFVWLGGPLNYGDYPNLQYDVTILGIAGRISFTGAVVSHLPYFSQFDIFALPSREDPFPLVALDAASLGLPVVCFAKAGGAPELVENDAGLVVPYLDVERMADAIIQLAEDDGLRQRMGDRARAKVHARHDVWVGGRYIAGVVQKYLKLSEKEEA